MNKFRLIFAVFILVVGFSSCLKDEKFPVEPIIEFKELLRYGHDSMDYIVKFTDGDGDIGVIQGDTSSLAYLIFEHKDTVTGTYYDTIITATDTFYMEPNSYYGIPNSTPFGQDKSLKGEIRIRNNSGFYDFANKPVYRYKCYIYDRAGNKSNVVYSNDIHY